MTKRVLLIEDNEISTYLIQQIFIAELPLVELRCVGTVAEGLEELDSGEYDLLILDMLLPDGNGLDVISKVNATNKILIVVLSAYDFDDMVHGARMLDIDAYVTKPVDTEEFLSLMRTLLIDYQS